MVYDINVTSAKLNFAIAQVSVSVIESDGSLFFTGIALNKEKCYGENAQ
jgi:hypothetical protein